MNNKFSVVFAASLLVVSVSLPAQENTGTVGRVPTLTPELKKPAAAPIAQPARKELVAQPADPSSTAKKLTINRFEFTGNTVFKSDELAAIVASYTNRPVSLGEIYDAADAVATFYAEQGYTLSSVGVPAQRIADGVVKLEVVEGRLGAVKTAGNKTYSTEQINDNFKAFNKGAVYRGDELEVALRQMNTLPGLSVQAVLSPGDAYGTSDLLIKAQETPSSALFAADNYGRKALGEYRGSMVLRLNNPAGLADQFELLLLESSGDALLYGFARYSLPLYVGGPRLSVSYSQAAITQTVVAPIVLDGSNKNARAGLMWDLVRDPKNELSAGVAVSYSNSNTDLASLSIARTRITLAEFTATYNRLHANGGLSQVTAGLTTNFQDENCSTLGSDCDQQLARFELDLQHLQPIGGGLDGYIRLNGVDSLGDPVTSASKTTIGGPANVRGFASASAQGDAGYFASTGIRYGVRAGTSLLSLRAFADHGYVKQFTTFIPGKDEELTSAGLGLDVQVTTHFNAKLDVSHPFGNESVSFTEGRDDVRLFGQVSINF